MKLSYANTLLFLSFINALVACGGKDNGPVVTDTNQSGATAADSAVAGGTSGTGGTGDAPSQLRGGGGGGGAGSVTSSGGAGGGSTMPNECQFDADSEVVNILLPQTLTFSITNSRSTTLYLHTPPNCSSSLSLYSCQDNYQSALAHTTGCSRSCSTEEALCVACSSCLDRYEDIAPGATIVRQWDGHYYTFDAAGACSCYESWVAPEGKYRVAIETYRSDVTSDDNTPTTVTVDFGYPDADGVVAVDL